MEHVAPTQPSPSIRQPTLRHILPWGSVETGNAAQECTVCVTNLRNNCSNRQGEDHFT